MSFKLEINEFKSNLNGIECYEKIDRTTLLKLINSKLLKTDFNNPMCKSLFKNEQEQLTKYLLNYKNGYVKVKYNKVKDMDNWGRCNPDFSLSLFSIRREIRQTLSKNYYTDIDIRACHQSILLQLCKRNKKKVPYLKSFVNNRDYWFDLFIKSYLPNIEYNIAKEIVKKLFIVLMYYGSYKKYFEEFNIEWNDENKEINDFIINYSKELREIAKPIMNDNKDLVKLIETKKEDELYYNKKGSVVSYYLQQYECIILETMFNYLCKKGIVNIIKPDVSLQADGLMIPTEKYLDNLLNELEEEIKNKTDFDLTLTTKEMTQDYLDILDDNIIDNSYKNCVETDADAAEVIYDSIKDKFKCSLICNTYFLFFKYSNFWTNNEEYIKINLSSIIRKFELYKMKKVRTKEGIEYDREAFGRNASEITNISKIIFDIAKTNLDNDFYNKLHDTTKSKLCFLDGVYCIDNKKFYLWNDEELIKNPVYSISYIDRNFKNFYDNRDCKENKKYVEEVKEIIRSIMGQQTDKCLKFLSRAVFGYIEDKDFAVFMGNRHCGKGVLTELINKSLTNNYMGIANANTFLCERDTKKDDGRDLMWVIDFQFKRLMISNEIKFDKDNDNIKINGVLLKNLFSGGDTIKSRENYKGFFEFNIQSKLLLMCNDLPPITTKDCYESIIEFTTTNQFLSQEQIDYKRNKIEEEIEDKKISYLTDENDLYKFSMYKEKELENLDKMLKKMEELDDNDKNDIIRTCKNNIRNELDIILSNSKDAYKSFEKYKEFRLQELKKYEIADPNIKDKIKKNENWKNAFILLMIDNWSDTKIIIENNNIDDDDLGSLRDIIYSKCIFKEDKDYFITFKDLKNLLPFCKCSLKKLKTELISMGGFEFRDSKNKGIRNFKLIDDF
jgi:hypothetical protein